MINDIKEVRGISDKEMTCIHMVDSQETMHVI